MSIRRAILKSPVAVKLLFPAVALASNHPTNLVDTPEKAVAILGVIAQWLFTIFFALAVIMLLYAAYLYLTAAGSQDKITSARKTLTWAIGAIVIAVVAGGVPSLIFNIITDTSTAPPSGSFGGSRNIPD